MRVFLIKLIVILLFSTFTCSKAQEAPEPIRTGAERVDQYIHLLENKNVALVGNHTSLINETHIIDSLLSLNVHVKAIFSPEHGIRGKEDAGTKINDAIDIKTGLPIFSLHGKIKKPTSEQLKNIDVVIFDMQDVGVRFYTYISTMHYVMESCAENKVPLIVLDRPNPLGDYIDGPVLDTAFRSFVGMHPIPVVHGLTIGELARMINGEGWLSHQNKCELTIIRNENWDHQTVYQPAVKPSPNLPNYQSLRLYPSLCFFEATDVSIGRGTVFPFQVYGYPLPEFGSFSFSPKSIKGMSSHPKQEGKTCYGIDLRNLDTIPQFTLKYLMAAQNMMPKAVNFISRPRWFNLLAGNAQLLQQLNYGMSEEDIRKSWVEPLNTYRLVRKKYLLYPDSTN